LVGILEDKRQLRQRIAMIASFRPARKARLLSLAFLVFLGLVCLTDAQAPKPKLPADTQSSQPLAAGDKKSHEVRVGADSSPAPRTNLTMQTLTLTVVDAETGVANSETNSTFPCP
jgi:hypothetical protein